MKLTDAEKEVVTNNHNLIYGYIRDRSLDEEEWYGLLAIELCKAVKHHNKHLGELSTFYYRLCDNLLYTKITKSNAQKRQDGGILSLDYEYEDGSCTYTMLDKIESDLDTTLDKIIVDEKLNELLDDEFGEIVKLRCEGYSQEEISEITGWSQSYISLILRRLRGELESGKINQ